MCCPAAVRPGLQVWQRLLSRHRPLHSGGVAVFRTAGLRKALVRRGRCVNPCVIHLIAAVNAALGCLLTTASTCIDLFGLFIWKSTVAVALKWRISRLGQPLPCQGYASIQFHFKLAPCHLLQRHLCIRVLLCAYMAVKISPDSTYIRAHACSSCTSGREGRAASLLPGTLRGSGAVACKAYMAKACIILSLRKLGPKLPFLFSFELF